MKKEKRYEYLLLNQLDNDIPQDENGFIGSPSLCNWCKYGEFSGCCSEPGFSCNHPLGFYELWDPDDVLSGSDCWGFRPVYSQPDVVDTVGMWLQGIRVNFSTIPITLKRGVKA